MALVLPRSGARALGRWLKSPSPRPCGYYPSVSMLYIHGGVNQRR